MRIVPVVVAFLSVLAADVQGQRTVWIVDKSGGGNFTEIQPAIDAASPGDRIEVRSSSYRSFALTKGLDLDAPQGATVEPSSIRNVPAGEWVRLSGFKITPVFPGGNLLAVALEVTQCPGPVLLSALRVSRFVTGPTAVISDCGSVLALDSTFVGGPAGPDYGDGGVGLLVRRSSLTAQRCTFHGGTGHDAQQSAALAGGSGLVAEASDAFLVECEASGGTGGNGRYIFICMSPGAPGGSGVFADRNSLSMARCRFTGGSGGSGVPGVCPPGTPGWAIGGAGTHRVASDSVLTGSQQNVVSIPPLPEIGSPGIATRGLPVTLTLRGLPGTVLLFYMDRVHQHVTIPGIDGPMLVTLAAIPAGVQNVGAGGSTPLVLQVPQDPQLRDQFVFFQGVAFQPGIPLPSLTNAGDLRIR